MLDCREVRTDFNCDSCFEITVEECMSININPALTPGQNYFLNIFDQFDLKRTQGITINLDGSFDIDLTLLPDNFFNPFGVFDFNVSSDEDGLNLITMTFAGDEYNCVVLSITREVPNDYVNDYVDSDYVE